MNETLGDSVMLKASDYLVEKRIDLSPMNRMTILMALTAKHL